MIEKAYPGDTLKACQVASDLADRFCIKTVVAKTVDGHGDLTEREVDICISIAVSLRQWSQKLRGIFGGRYSTEARTATRVVGMASSLPNETASLHARARFLGTTPAMLVQEQARWLAWLDDHNLGLLNRRGKERKDKFPIEWVEQTRAAWLDPAVTRASERTRDELQDPADRKRRVRKHLLETRVGVALRKIMSICKAFFHPTFQYSDGRARPDGYTAKRTFVRCLRPFNVKDSFGNKNTSLCRRHMQMEKWLNALHHYQRLLRSKKLVPADQALLPADNYEARRLLTCERQDRRRCAAECPCRESRALVSAETKASDGALPPFDNLLCLQNKCDKCRDLRLLVGHAGRRGRLAPNELGRTDMAIKWEQWCKETNPVTKELVWDFRTKTTSVEVMIADMKQYWAGFLVHHFEAKWFSRDKKYKRRHFPRGTVHCVQDFSQNGDFDVKDEHHSRYYESHQYTLYGMPFDSHIDDRTDIPEEEKTRLKAMMDKQGLPHIITDSVIVITPDTLHDVSAVIHFNKHVLVPLLRRLITGLTGILVTSDGAPNQYYNKDLMYWLSTAEQQTKDGDTPGIWFDWVVGVAAHGKDLSDGECGAGKNSVNTANMEHVSGDQDGRHQSIETDREVVSHLRAHFRIRDDNVIKKKGHGLYRRHVIHVPLRAISRRRPDVDAIAYRNADGVTKGIKSLKQFISCGRPGKLICRGRPCHFCTDCNNVTALRANPAGLSCPHTEHCGRLYTVTVKAAAAAASTRVLRQDVERRGLRLCREATKGDFVAVEAEEGCLPYFMGEVCDGEILGDDTKKMKVRRWLPLASGGGCNIYTYQQLREGTVDAFADVLCSAVRACIKPADADGGGDFALVNRSALQLGRREEIVRQDQCYCKTGTVICYMFKDAAPQWSRGVVKKMQENGMAHVEFDDGDPFYNLPVSKSDLAESGGNKIRFMSGYGVVHDHHSCRCKAGTVIDYHFADTGKWYRGTVKQMRANGLAHVEFDDGEPFLNLPVSDAQLAQPSQKGNKLHYVSNYDVVTAGVPPPHRRLSAAAKQTIAAALLPP